MFCLESRMPQRKMSPCLASWSSAKGLRDHYPALHIHHQDDPSRARVESYIGQRYRQRYGARVKTWLPTLVSLQVNGEILAAAGYRSAGTPLFLERYLSAPIEQYIRDRGASVERRLIVEVGHFAAMRPGAGRLLIPLVVKHLHQQGFDWAVSTLTVELHHLFSRMGLAHRSLSVATAAHLSAQEREEWGNYYSHSPQVFAGRLNTILGCFPEEGI